MKKGRIPRKLKKEWKKNPYFKFISHILINNYKMNNVIKKMKKYYGINIQHFASVGDTGESIQGTKLKGTGTHVFYFI